MLERLAVTLARSNRGSFHFLHFVGFALLATSLQKPTSYRILVTVGQRFRSGRACEWGYVRFGWNADTRSQLA